MTAEPTGFAHTDSDYGTPTVLRFHRTLADAFADERAPAIERPPRNDVTRMGHRAVLWVSVVGLAVMCALLIGGM